MQGRLFKTLFIPYVFKEWNRLSTKIRNSLSCKEFRKSLSSFTKTTCSSRFSIHRSIGVKLLVRLRLGFSHLREPKFRQNFQDALNPLCSCCLEPETTLNYLLCRHNFSSANLGLINDLNLIDPTVSQLNETALPFQTYFYMVIQRKAHQRIAKFSRVELNI